MRVLQIQGLRALAVVIVILYHAKLLPGGFIGVDIFYVISGYLITGLILRELDTTGRLNLSAFYQRRIKRLLPSSALVLLVTAIVAWFVLPSITRDSLGRDLIAAAAYISNYLFAWWENDYQNLNATPSPFIHYWSLAVEEQFYLVWPILMIALARYGKRVIVIGVSTITVLYGDSHAAQWFPALEKLANTRHFRLISLTKSGCPSVDVPRPDKGAYKNMECEKWRENSIARIKSIQPTAVIVSSLQFYPPPSGNSDRDKWWGDGQKRLLSELKVAAKYLIYISDTPRPMSDIPACLASRDSSSCDTTQKTEVKVISGFIVINPTPWLCTSLCPAIKDSIVAYRDGSHISMKMSLHLAPKLESALKATGLFG